ncbi:thioredoxin family protein [Anaerobacillus alkaliphilus]|uniref:Thioredoxin family protein n=1 Tax=Anaerobacillus alkaliphilus TaxID=1548597 RepID=A0A4Q0VPM9_9BACI|nr:thioredoxin family protein [Anaerobacillus alkaliphilus]RXI98363.1 thioredoxin family protein [Anaerobacillus alkaliphilus]
MEIKLLVTSSINCKLFERRVLEAVEAKGIYAEIEKIDSFPDAKKYGVIYMPALVVNGKVVSSGKLLSKEEILRLIFI